MLFACGSNGSGQLGLGHYEDVSQWVPVDLNLEGEIDFCAGGNHTVILERGRGRVLITRNAGFVCIDHPDSLKWVKASAGWAFTILVDEENRLWSLGDGPSGELGLGTDTVEVHNPTRIEWLPSSRILDLKSGMRHSVLLTESGELYGWGNSRKNQCGVQARVVSSPQRFPERTLPILRVACGRDYTAVVRKGGVLEVWGDRQRFFPDEEAPLVDSEAELMSGWSAFAVGHTIFGNTSQSHLQASAFRGRLGAMGSEHALTLDLRLVSCYGWGEHGNCPPPKEFDGEIRVFGGCATSFAYTMP